MSERKVKALGAMLTLLLAAAITVQQLHADSPDDRRLKRDILMVDRAALDFQQRAT